MSYDENKQMVLEIIYSMDTIINLRSSEFQNYFNGLYNSVYNSKNEFSNITEMNKYILNNCYQFINDKTSQLKTQLNTTNMNYNTPQKQPITIETIDINDIRHKKDDKFSLKLKSKQEEFDNLINNKVPDEIDFSDKPDDSSQNLDVLMSQSLADREKELQMITKKYNEKKTKDFLKPQDTRSDNKKAKDEDRSKNKKVTFNIEETPKNELSNDVSSFLSKLKKEPIETIEKNDELKERIENILSNQEKILSNQDKILELLKND